MRTAKLLARRGIQVYREEGLRRFLGRTGRFLRTNLLPLKNNPLKGYDDWILMNENYKLDDVRETISGFAHKPIISIITPVFNAEPIWLDRLLESILSQYYEYWELVLYDDGSTESGTRFFLRNRIPSDSRIKVHFGEANEGISRASNAALGLSRGEFVTFVDQHDELASSALYEVAKLLNEDVEADIIFSDEDKITADRKGAGKRHAPFFKPGWDPILLLGSMYIGHLAVYRRRILDALGGLRGQFDFSQDYDLALRATEHTVHIRHVPKVLYHGRSVPRSAAAAGKAFARTSNIAAVQAAMERRGLHADVIEGRHCNRVRIRSDKPSLVSVIIPTDNERNIVDCLNSLLCNTSHSMFEIIVVTNSGLARMIDATYSDDHRVRVSKFDKPFNFSQKCNQGASEARGDLLLFLNDDVRPMHESWLDAMLEMLAHKDVGGVSPKMCYEDGSIQYAGMATGVRGGVATMFNGVPGDSPMYFNLVQTPRCVSVLSGACLLMKRKIFFQVGGFDAENTPTMDSDLDLSFKLLDLGYLLAYQPFALLMHFGHSSIGEIECEERHLQERRGTAIYMLKRWGNRLSNDDYFTENMRYFLHEEGDSKYKLIADRQEDKYLNARNILIINHELSLTGAPILTFQVARHLRKQGFFVVSASPSYGPCASLYARENIPLMIEPAALGVAPIHWQAAQFMRCFDVVIVSTIVCWRTVRALKDWGVPVIWFVQETVSMTKEIERHHYREVEETLSLVDDVVIYGQSTAEDYCKENVKGNFHLLPFAAAPLCVSRKSNKTPGNFVILHVGSCEPRKGQDLLVKAILDLPQKYARLIELKLVGGFQENKFGSLLRRLAHGNDSVKFLGQVPREEIGNYYSEADLFVCPSRDETGPLVVAEAMSFGKPVISTRVGSVPEMIVHGESGIIIDVDDAKGLSEAIIMLIDNPDERERLARNAAKRFGEHLSMDAFAERFASIVERRMGGSHYGDDSVLLAAQM